MADILSRLDGVKLGLDTKYATKNPIARRMIRGYFTALEQLVRQARFESLLEVGCGEGIPLHMLSRSRKGSVSIGIDLMLEKLKVGSANIPQVPLSAASVYELPFQDKLFDLVICCEVLEHLKDPEAALAEIDRVGSEWFIFSVPNEPLWRALNMARGAYWGGWGNTPDHIQHWSSITFRGLLNSRFRVEKILKPMPWTMALCRKA
jgi:2-polyprenyl-3-methyl-5-hydroxy-6-metoxy-1,4-benzoquinol methylase